MSDNKQKIASKKGLLANLIDKYNAFCKEMGVDQGGGCRRCVPIIRQDTDLEKKDRTKITK